MKQNVLGIHNQTIGAYWTIFILIFALLVGLGIRIWINVGMASRFKTPEPVRIEQGFALPRLKNKTNPAYARSTELKLEDEILIEVITDVRGRVVSAKVLNIDPFPRNRKELWRLYSAARKAVLQWTFEPYEYKGEVRPAVFTVAVDCQ